MLSCKKWLFIKEEDPTTIYFFLLLSPLSSISPLSCPSHSSTWMMILKPRRKVSHFRNCSSTQNESGPKQLSLKGNRRHWRWKKPTLAILLSSFLLICYLSLFPLNFSGEFQLENIRSSGNKPIGFATTQKLPVENKFSQIHKWTNEKYTNEKYTNTQIKNTEIQATKK